MDKLEIYKDYIGKLGSLDVRRFEKVIGMYDELRPMNYFIVKKGIEEAKSLTDVGRASMLQHNEYIFESLFTYLGNMVLFEFVRLVAREYGISDVVVTNQREALIGKLRFTEITSTIRSFFDMYADNELSFNPCYQRGLVWSNEQKELFIKALLKGVVRLTPTYVFNGFSSDTKLYEVLDGKQRLTTLLEFVRNKFTVDGIYYKDWGYEDVRAFHKLPLVYTLVDGFDDEGLTLALKVELFLQLNSYGEVVDKVHLEMIQKKYLENKLEVKNE